MEYWHPHLPFGQHISVSTLVYEKIKQKKTPVVYKTDKIANLHGHEGSTLWT
jgi:hypothetical protein